MNEFFPHVCFDWHDKMYQADEIVPHVSSDLQHLLAVVGTR